MKWFLYAPFFLLAGCNLADFDDASDDLTNSSGAPTPAKKR
jgi:hypothetical protein